MPAAPVPPEPGAVPQANQTGKDPTTGISPKVTGATLGGALATILWIGVNKAFGGFDMTELATLTGATGTVFSFALGYWITDPTRKP